MKIENYDYDKNDEKLIKEFDNKWHGMYDAIIKKTIACEKAKTECLALRKKQEDVIKILIHINKQIQKNTQMLQTLLELLVLFTKENNKRGDNVGVKYSSERDTKLNANEFIGGDKKL